MGGARMSNYIRLKTTVMIIWMFQSFCLKIQPFLKNIHPSTGNQYRCLYIVNIWNVNLTITYIQPLISGERRPLGVSVKVKSNKVYTTNISFAYNIETGSSQVCGAESPHLSRRQFNTQTSIW